MTALSDARTQHIRAVAIGASAGGVEALMLLLPELPAALRVPVLVVVHLPPQRPSLLVDVFKPRCAVPLEEAEDKLPLRPGTVYFAPPDYHLLVDPGAPDDGPVLALSVDPPVKFSRPAIDVLFESAADHYRAALLGIVLTGANDDGAEGLAAVQRLGGLAVVQQPDTALASAMPLAALQRCPGARTLPLAGITDLLAGLGGGRAA